MPSPSRRRARCRERAAHLLEGVLRYLVTHPAQLLLASLLLVCARAVVVAPFVPGSPPPVSTTPTLASLVPTAPRAPISPGESATAQTPATSGSTTSPATTPGPSTPPATAPAVRMIRINPGDTCGPWHAATAPPSASSNRSTGWARRR